MVVASKHQRTAGNKPVKGNQMSLIVKLADLEFRLTDEHAAGSYGIPVLVDAEGLPHGPMDWFAAKGATAAGVVNDFAVWARDMLSVDQRELCDKFAPVV
jgi:hypothetical protein